MNNYFNSDSFINELRPLKDILKRQSVNQNVSLIEYVVGKAIQYFIMFDNGDKSIMNEVSSFTGKITDFISKENTFSMLSNSKLDGYVNELYLDAILAKNNMTKENLTDDDKKVQLYQYMVRHIAIRKNKFHAFNSASYESIKEHGLDPKFKITKDDEINHINQIFESYGVSMVFGWHQLNCIEKIYYSNNPSVAYYYAANSPEWFSQFTGQGFPFNNFNIEYSCSAFLEGDYVAAKNNLEILMSNKKFTRQDKDTVFSFFDRSWKIYANNNPMLAIIPDDSASDDFEYWTNQLLTEPYYRDDIKHALGLCFDINSNTDCQTSEVINVDDAMFIELPKYSEVIKKINSPQVVETLEETENISDESLHEKLMSLAHSKIAVRRDENGQEEWVSKHGVEEVEKVKRILKDDAVYKAIITDKFGTGSYLNGWIGLFDSKIINDVENIRLLALNKPTYMSYVSQEYREDLTLMRNCASQDGVHPILTCYVGENVQNDFQFISNLIINSNDKTFDFFGSSDGSIRGSKMRYGKSIGLNVQENPDFWILLNSKIESINQKSTRFIPPFSIEKELGLAIGTMAADMLLSDHPVENIQESHKKI